MTDLVWRIDTERDDGGVITNGLEGAMPNYTRGQRVTLSFMFWDEAVGTYASGATFGPADGATFGGDAGATFGSIDVANHVERYLAARDYLDYAGAASVNHDIDGQVHFQERIPSDAPVDSLVVDVVPGGDYVAGQGFWGVVMGGKDPTTNPLDFCRLDLDIVVLAERDDYATKADLRASLSGSIA